MVSGPVAQPDQTRRVDAAVVASAEAAGPGFVNLHYGDVALEGMVDRARRNPEAWGRAASSEAGGASSTTAP